MPRTIPVTLDRQAPEPLGTQLAHRIRELVLTGTLGRGDRLPSSRALAADLGVSRSVPEQAYEQLHAEGWVEARQGAGTFVASGTTPRTPRAPARAPAPHPSPAPPSDLVPLSSGTPWIDPRHADGWRRAWREVSAARPPRGYDDPRGIPELRAALADRLARTRGLVVDPDEIVVTQGTTDGLRHLLQSLPPGPVAVEDPGYRAAVAVVRRLGREVRDVPALDPVTDLRGCAAAYVTPAHQHPLGRVMPAADRLALLAAARDADAVVAEDDYDSEFRYDVAPVPALAALDRDRVAYLGTASKSVAPSLRLGWLVPPSALLDGLDERRRITHEGAPWPVQRAMLALLRDGYVDKVVRSARRVYAERAPRVAAALSPYAELAGPLAGMYSTWLLPHDDAVRAVEAARAAGFDVPLLSTFARSSRATGLVVGFGGVTDAELDAALTALVRGLRGPGR
ncbi:transcriptional regulator, GntR family with aminotransferase domain [Xylanimonas cellulosilytica DSM 15894]|uniref:Transcriptional regulator, GntR family with aminotransferase domain n=1 Tax=Xylanimonas cellulosilytica (strain DSM 15894 / JCM 12276 / CECT 5975 / KCTC 9989 / LMG 20990 / NBRC 107835 / XIL07) TaxID=446471 RepID=D1BZB4_XYLCX|nr:PLP-dependent aminotransferase family protein [Xylanimonas cellulosilytica]ACZ32011.1 transcriptional regulator, GntR family with aminotransferase domain [Xylanimonas cellulosilytica DSM 15894]